MRQVCTKCGEEKELNDFYRDKQRHLGYRRQCKACVRAYNTPYCAQSERRKDKQRATWLTRKHGITIAEWEAVWKHQDGKCAMCQQPLCREVKRGHLRTCVHHSPQSGHRIGLAHGICNILEGIFKKDPKELVTIIDGFQGHFHTFILRHRYSDPHLYSIYADTSDSA